MRARSAFDEAVALVDLDEGPSDQELMHCVMPGLKELATGQDLSGKDWLKQFLTTVSDTPEAHELKTLLRLTVNTTRMRAR